MTIETKKIIANNIRELYLYPYRSKGENLFRGGVLLGAWIIGILSQKALNNNALGGAYIVFSLSLLLEFAQDSKNETIPRIIHGIFVFLQFVLFLGSLVLSYFPNSNSPDTGVAGFLAKGTEPICTIICIMIFVSCFLTLIDAHRIFYNEIDSDKDEKLEVVELREQFMKNLKGNEEEVKK